MCYRMLLVDDNAEDLSVYAAAFRRAGHTVIEASSGDQGFRLLQEEQPDVLVSSFPMPLEDGRTLEEAAAQTRAARPVIVAHTSWSSARTCARALHVGCDFFYKKPTPGETILEAIDTVHCESAVAMAD